MVLQFRGLIKYFFKELFMEKYAKKCTPETIEAVTGGVNLSVSSTP